MIAVLLSLAQGLQGKTGLVIGRGVSSTSMTVFEMLGRTCSDEGLSSFGRSSRRAYSKVMTGAANGRV